MMPAHTVEGEMSGNQAARYHMFGGLNSVSTSPCSTILPCDITATHPPDAPQRPYHGSPAAFPALFLHNALQQIEDARLRYHIKSVVGSSAMINGDSHSTAIAISCAATCRRSSRTGTASARARVFQPHRFYGSGKRGVIGGFPSARQVSRAWVCMVCSGLKACAGSA